jgi:hypothetical protein
MKKEDVLKKPVNFWLETDSCVTKLLEGRLDKTCCSRTLILLLQEMYLRFQYSQITQLLCKKLFILHKYIYGFYLHLSYSSLSEIVMCCRCTIINNYSLKVKWILVNIHQHPLNLITQTNIRETEKKTTFCRDSLTTSKEKQWKVLLLEQYLPWCTYSEYNEIYQNSNPISMWETLYSPVELY